MYTYTYIYIYTYNFGIHLKIILAQFPNLYFGFIRWGLALSALRTCVRPCLVAICFCLRSRMHASINARTLRNQALWPGLAHCADTCLHAYGKFQYASSDWVVGPWARTMLPVHIQAIHRSSWWRETASHTCAATSLHLRSGAARLRQYVRWTCWDLVPP